MKSWIQRQLAAAGVYLSQDIELRSDIARIEKRVLEIKENTGAVREAVRVMAPQLLQIALGEEERRLLADIRLRTPENIVLHGRKVFSQCDEDGIIASIFAKLGGERTFIEIGCGDGIENNTHLLLLEGWKGVWVDGSQELIAGVSEMLGGLVFPRLLVEHQFIEADNVCELIERYCRFTGGSELDFFSIDIDGNELPVLQEVLKVAHPRVLCVEYNAKFPPPLVTAIGYDPAHRWANDDYQGCSLMALVGALRSRYTLLTCTLSGVNAFFVRNDLTHPFKIYPPEELYQRARYHRLQQIAGHPPSPRWLRDALAEPPPLKSKIES